MVDRRNNSNRNFGQLGLLKAGDVPKTETKPDRETDDNKSVSGTNHGVRAQNINFLSMERLASFSSTIQF